MNPTIAGLVLMLACISLQARAHGGRTNAEGCHNDRKNGGYHCHNGTSSSPTTHSSADGKASSFDGNQRNDRTYYPNCTAARAAGATPLRRGDAGYGKHLDRDNDGVACE